MPKHTTVMTGGIAMASIMGAMMIWWLALSEGSGFVEFLFIVGMLVGMAVFAGGAAEAIRSAGHHTTGRDLCDIPSGE